jgi:hypothetical protein
MDRARKQNAAAWELPGMLLREAGIHDPWFALTQLVGPELAPLTRAPDAPIAAETPQQKKLDEGMRNIADLRLLGTRAALWPTAAAMAAQSQPSSAADTGARSEGP